MRRLRPAHFATAMCTLLLGVVCGCSHAAPMVARPQNLDLPERAKSDIPVRLVIPARLRLTKWVDAQRVGWEAPKYEMGDALATDSTEVVRALFSDVEVAGAGTGVEAKSGSNRLVIEPKVVDIEQNRPLWRWQDRTITISYEWSVSRPDGRPVWVDTVVASGTNRLDDPDQERVALMMKDLFSKSFAALGTAIDDGRLGAR